jgi:hypothetical protein
VFSLIVSIISVLLVVSLAVAALNYSGGAVNASSGKAYATKISNQAEQLIAAATLFRTNYGRWPDNVEELLANGEFIKQAPMANLTTGDKFRLVANAASEIIVPSAHAEASRQWGTVSVASPQYVLNRRVSTSACLYVNTARAGFTGIRASADPTLPMQCFGRQEPYTVLAQVPLQGNSLTTETLQTATGDPDMAVETGGGAWAVPPGAGG